jgi:hypothetical protein
LLGGRSAEVPNIIRGYVMLWSDLPRMLRARGGSGHA